MKGRLRGCVILVCAAFVLRAHVAGAAPQQAWGKIEVLRDTWGVPHIFSETDAGAMYGLGYVTAEDRAFQMYYCLRIIQGRVAETLGDVRKVSGDETALDHDKRMRTFGFHRAAKKVVASLPPQTLELLEAYSDGVNDYMRENRSELLYLFERLRLEPEPWLPEHCILSWWRFGQFFTGDGLGDAPEIQSVALPRRVEPGSQQPPRSTADDSAAVVRAEDVSEEWMRRVRDFASRWQKSVAAPTGAEAPKFSHAWVAGGKKTTKGSAVLCSDPQTPVRNPSILYQFHVSGKTFNARGVGVAGSPVLLIGWNQNVAWGMTALGADQADLFVLRTDERRPNKYYFDGQWRDMSILQETIRVKGKEPQTITIRETHIGPIVTGLTRDVQAGREVALGRIPICETDRDTIDGALGMMRARDASEFVRAIGAWRFPTANVVFGDSQGNIGYSILGAVPVRSPLSPRADQAHDGSLSAHAWQGTIPQDLVPHVLNPKRGYIVSGNNRPVESFYPLNLGIGTGAGGDTTRSWRLRERLEMKAVMTPEEVLEVHYDCVNPAKREVVRLGYHIRDVQGERLSDEALKALNHLEGWYEKGASSDMTLEGAELVQLMPLNFRRYSTSLADIYGGGETGLCHFLKSLSLRLRDNPKELLSSEERAFVDMALASAWQNAEKAYGSDRELWHERGLATAGKRRMGYFESLDGFPSLDEDNDVDSPNLRCVDGSTIRSQMSQAYTQWVPLHDVDSAKSVLPIGQSERPDSPYRASNAEAWRTGELHPAPITRAGVDKYVASSKTLTGAKDAPEK